MKKGIAALLFIVLALCAAAALIWSFWPRNFWQVFDTETYRITRAEAWVSSIDGTETRQVVLTKGDPALDMLVYYLTDQLYKPDRSGGTGGSLEMDPYVTLVLYTDDGTPRVLNLYGEPSIMIDGKRFIPSHGIAGQGAIRDLLLAREKGSAFYD